jgi:hypothetical protein
VAPKGEVVRGDGVTAPPFLLASLLSLCRLIFSLFSRVMVVASLEVRRCRGFMPQPTMYPLDHLRVDQGCPSVGFKHDFFSPRGG